MHLSICYTHFQRICLYFIHMFNACVYCLYTFQMHLPMCFIHFQRICLYFIHILKHLSILYTHVQYIYLYFIHISNAFAYILDKCPLHLPILYTQLGLAGRWPGCPGWPGWPAQPSPDSQNMKYKKIQVPTEGLTFLIYRLFCCLLARV